MSRLMSAVIRHRSGVVLALALATTLSLLASPALAQQTCTQVGGSCWAVDGSASTTCPSGTLEQSSASCGQGGGQALVCCAPQACENRSDNAVCYPGVQACPAGTTSLGDGGCANGPCCTQVTTGPTCGERLGRTDGACVQAPESCPANYSYVGPTRDCESCCAPPGAPTPTPTPPPTGTGGGGTYRVEYLHTDALGSVRMVTDQSGAVVSRHDYYPFGGEIGAGVNGRSGIPGYAVESGDPRTRERFTGKERDAESGLDYYGARYYSGAQGRFTRPDDFRKDSQVSDPQSWNKYQYARNNPLKYLDRNGEKATVGTTCTTDQQNQTTCQVNIQASIAVYADPRSGLTSQQVASAAATIKSSIESAWTGSARDSGVTYNVSTTLSVTVAADLSAAVKSGADNVIGLTDGNALPRADSFVDSRSLWGAISGSGPDSGVWNVRNLGRGIASHEFAHLLGIGDRSGREMVLSNTNILNIPGIPQRATSGDFLWGIQEAAQANRVLGARSAAYGFFGPVTTETRVQAGWIWWK